MVPAARRLARRFFAEEVADGRQRDRLVMARALGALFVAGAVIGIVSLGLPHRTGADIDG